MGKSAIFSGLLHLAVVLVTIFGLPWLYDTTELMQVTPVGVISEEQFAQLMSKQPPAQPKKDQPKDKTIPEAPKAPAVAEPEPEPEPTPEPQPAPEPEAQAEPAPQPAPEPEPEPAPPAPEPEAVAPEPQPEEQVIAPEPPVEPEPQPVPPPEPQVAEAQPKPVPPKKPTPPKKQKKEEKKEETKKKKETEKPKDKQVASDDDFFKNLDKKLKEKQKAQESQPAENQEAVVSDDSAVYQRLSMSDEDAIKQYIESCWSIDPGIPGIEEMTVEIQIEVNPDGTTKKAKYAPSDGARAKSDRYYRSFAESVMRAVNRCDKLPIPRSKSYEVWKRMTFVFDPRGKF